MRGRGIGKYEYGERVMSITDLKIGDILIKESRHFNALNMIQVIGVDRTGLGRPIFYWSYVDASKVDSLPPVNESTARSDGGMWQYELEDPSTPVFRPVAPAKA